MIPHPRQTLNRSALCLLLLPFGMLSLYGQTDDPAPAIAGVYYCEGSNGDGSSYHGVVRIARHGDAYHVGWRLQPRAEAVGLAIRNGDTLAVSYYGQNTGVVLYRIVGDRLLGEWTAPGGDGVLASETLMQIEDATGPLFEPAPAEPGADRRRSPNPPVAASTLGGLSILHRGACRAPATRTGLQFQVVYMDGKRIDRVPALPR